MTARGVLATLLALALLGADAGGAAASITTPSGYREVAGRAVHRGVDFARFRITGDAPQSVNVARIASGSAVSLRAVRARGQSAGPAGRLQTTSSMCRAVSCLVAINGDFFHGGVPTGGMVAGGEVLRLPRSRPGLILGPDGTLNIGTLNFRGELVSSDLTRIRLNGVNVPRYADRLALYTPAFGASTRTNRWGVEIAFEVVEPAGPLRIGDTSVVRLTEMRDRRGNMRIPRNGGVLSGHGERAAALRDLWVRIEAGEASPEVLLRMESRPPAHESIAGRPVLVQNGRVVVSDSNAFARTAGPRTLVGWNARGDVWLVTVDGRQSGRAAGMSLREAARFMIGLGATEAINLDGGGSSTFVVRGQTVNRPSDGRERPVASALAVVQRHTAPSSAPRTPPSLTFEIPEAAGSAAPVAPLITPPASSALPALLARPAEERETRRGIGALLIVAVPLLAGTAILRRRRRRHWEWDLRS